MKRCPQCEFVYEENQRHCDMDGVELVHDPCELPKNKTHSQIKVTSSILQLFAIALPAILLGSLIIYGSTGQVAHTPAPATEIDTPATPNVESEIEPASHSLDAPDSETTAPATPAPAEEKESKSAIQPEVPSPAKTTDTPDTSRSETEATEKANSKPSRANESGEEPSRPVASPDSKPGPQPLRSATPREVRKPRATTTQNSKKSTAQNTTAKVGSFFKKTGRLLKKPFQL